MGWSISRYRNPLLYLALTFAFFSLFSRRSERSSKPFVFFSFGVGYFITEVADKTESKAHANVIISRGGKEGLLYKCMRMMNVMTYNLDANGLEHGSIRVM